MDHMLMFSPSPNAFRPALSNRKILGPPIVRSVGAVTASSKDKVVLAGDYSSLGDELNRLTRIPASMVRSVRTLEKKPYLSE